MTQETMPAVGRLHAALAEAGRVTQEIIQIMQQAEEEAARPFKTDGEGGATTDTAEVTDINADGGEPFPDRTDFNGITLSPDGGGVAPTAEEQSLIDQILSLEMPWWLDLGLSFFVVGDIIDLVREQILKRFSGQSPDLLVTALAGLGLAADLGWINPVPSAEDAPNAILGALKVVAKRLPAGEARDALAALVEKAIKNPDEMARLAKLSASFAEHTDVLAKLMENPRAMMAAIEGGSETVTLMARYGDDAIKAADLLGKHAPDYLKYCDDLADVPGVQNLLKDLAAGDTTTFGAMGELYYFQSIKGDLAEVGLKGADGKKAADAILKDGTVVDVKNWNFDSFPFTSEGGINNKLRQIESQVERYKSLYGEAKIRYVFTMPLDDIPPQFISRL
jgi:hypothetical protein